MSLDLINKYNAEFAAKDTLTFTTLEQVYNTPLTGDEEKDMLIADAVVEFVSNEDTSMSDKIAALKYIASIFGEDPDAINEEFVNEMMEEETAKINKANGNSEKGILKLAKEAAAISVKTAAPRTASGKQWFGSRKLNENQVLKSADLEAILSKSNKAVKKYTDAFYEQNTRIARSILKKIGKLADTKVRTVSEVRKNGYLFVVFSVDVVLDFPNVKQRNGIRITKHGSKEYHLFVGDLNVNT